MFIAVIYASVHSSARPLTRTHARTPGNRSVFTAVLVIDTWNVKLVGAPTSFRILPGTINSKTNAIVSGVTSASCHSDVPGNFRAGRV